MASNDHVRKLQEAADNAGKHADNLMRLNRARMQFRAILPAHYTRAYNFTMGCFGVLAEEYLRTNNYNAEAAKKQYMAHAAALFDGIVELRQINEDTSGENPNGK